MRSRSGRDRGQVAIEYVGWLPLLLLVALIGIQVGLVSYAAQAAGTAARTAARVESLHPEQGRTAGEAAVGETWAKRLTWDQADAGGTAVTFTARVQIPSIVPGLRFDDAVRTSTMPNDVPGRS
ncbi:TadE/TadG family type IV pilus assembly protein [Streptomyces sp. NPDC101118]|uniref:TadE/TadG family type IV pilus assembly protein n=1 Tax=Streptomyces sp. NPDC101118 TaxID=3366109 RepID=UPI003815E332